MQQQTGAAHRLSLSQAVVARPGRSEVGRGRLEIFRDGYAVALVRLLALFSILQRDVVDVAHADNGSGVCWRGTGMWNCDGATPIGLQRSFLSEADDESNGITPDQHDISHYGTRFVAGEDVKQQTAEDGGMLGAGARSHFMKSQKTIAHPGASGECSYLLTFPFIPPAPMHYC